MKEGFEEIASKMAGGQWRIKIPVHIVNIHCTYGEYTEQRKFKLQYFLVEWNWGTRVQTNNRSIVFKVCFGNKVKIGLNWFELRLLEKNLIQEAICWPR